MLNRFGGVSETAEPSIDQTDDIEEAYETVDEIADAPYLEPNAELEESKMALEA
jgi:hypothetical protein